MANNEELQREYDQLNTMVDRGVGDHNIQSITGSMKNFIGLLLRHGIAQHEAVEQLKSDLRTAIMKAASDDQTVITQIGTNYGDQLTSHDRQLQTHSQQINDHHQLLGQHASTISDLQNAWQGNAHMLRQLQDTTDRCIAQQLAVGGIESRVAAAEQHLNQLAAASSGTSAAAPSASISEKRPKGIMESRAIGNLKSFDGKSKFRLFNHRFN